MKNHGKTIFLSDENLSKYGFSCFQYQEGPSGEDDFWFREIEIASNTRIIKIPKRLLIGLSTVDRIVNSVNYNINFDIPTIDPIKLLSERAGWNQTIADLEAMKAHARLPSRPGGNGYSLATYDHANRRIPLGSGLSLPVSNDTSWIGMILVHPELRRQGIARSIMNACLEHARLIQNKSIVGLDATPQGKQVYDSLGFVDSYKIWRSNISTGSAYDPALMVNTAPFDIESIRTYLNRINNTERFQIAELLGNLPDSNNIMAVSGSVVSGFVMSRPGRLKPFIGPLIADSKVIAMKLLNQVLMNWKSMGFEHAFIDIPEYHIGQGSLFVDEHDNFYTTKKLQLSINLLRSFVRMYQLISELKVEENLQNSLLRRPLPGEAGQARMSKDSKKVLKRARDSYEKTLAYMEKERNEIIPSMYAIGGPEMS